MIIVYNYSCSLLYIDVNIKVIRYVPKKYVWSLVIVDNLTSCAKDSDNPIKTLPFEITLNRDVGTVLMVYEMLLLQ